jgi:hypothetical protein
MIPALRHLSDADLGELRRRLHREFSGASAGAELALASFCVMVGDELASRDGLALRTGCPACLTTLRAGLSLEAEDREGKARR